MTGPLSILLDGRSNLLRQISGLGDFQPGSITSAIRRRGKPGCHCAKPDDSGHGPHFQLTQKISGKTATQQLPSQSAVCKAEKEIAEFRRFQCLSDELVVVNRKVCRLRPVEQTAQSAQENNGGSDPAGIAVCGEPLLGLSIGAVSCPEQGCGAKVLLAEADRRMYLAKRERRGPVPPATRRVRICTQTGSHWPSICIKELKILQSLGRNTVLGSHCLKEDKRKS